ncbi:hypothetical protein V8F33_013004, partial [Rhypophila sp. PSN 637]
MSSVYNGRAWWITFVVFVGLSSVYMGRAWWIIFVLPIAKVSAVAVISVVSV